MGIILKFEKELNKGSKNKCPRNSRFLGPYNKKVEKVILYYSFLTTKVISDQSSRS